MPVFVDVIKICSGSCQNNAARCSGSHRRLPHRATTATAFANRQCDRHSPSSLQGHSQFFIYNPCVWNIIPHSRLCIILTHQFWLEVYYHHSLPLPARIRRYNLPVREFQASASLIAMPPAVIMTKLRQICIKGRLRMEVAAIRSAAGMINLAALVLPSLSCA